MYTGVRCEAVANARGLLCAQSSIDAWRVSLRRAHDRRRPFSLSRLRINALAISSTLGGSWFTGAPFRANAASRFGMRWASPRSRRDPCTRQA
jgi:hypothetical protein